jgi:hypothetical protein
VREMNEDCEISEGRIESLKGRKLNSLFIPKKTDLLKKKLVFFLKIMFKEREKK